MRKLMLLLPIAAMTAACQPMSPEDRATATGALGGAAIGAAVAHDSAKGAIIGAAAGAVAGNLIGRSQQSPDQCVYQDSYGRRYTARCP